MISLAPEVVDWLASVLGSHGSSRVTTRFEATTSTVLALEGDLVLRWYDDQSFLAEEPDAIAREVAALGALAGSAVPAPGLIAASERAPVAVLMTRLPGSPDPYLPEPAAVIDLLEAIHAVPPGPLARWSYAGYHEGRNLARPAWWRDAGTWERAVRQTSTARPTGPGVLIHRDFHPGNLLWTGHDITGIVDWVNTCVGPAEFDAAHMRVNLAIHEDVANADRVVTGNPAWDIEAAFGLLDWWTPAEIDTWAGPFPQADAWIARAAIEAFVAEALARLG